ncbi:MAG: hypothetical protein ACKOVB_23900, partial [Terrabacter sp.]
HLGMLTGRAARGTTWQVLDEWVAQWSGEVPTPARTRHGKKAAAKKAPAKKASAETIGSNPSRRYGSSGSRALGRRG